MIGAGPPENADRGAKRGPDATSDRNGRPAAPASHGSEPAPQPGTIPAPPPLTPTEATNAATAAPPGEAGLGSRAARGAVASLSGQLVKATVQMLSVILLARLLAVEEFGIVALILAFIGIGEIVRDFGLSTAAISVPSLSTGQRSNLWWINVGIGALLAGILAVGAPLIAAFFDEPQVTDVARVMALVLLLNGAGSQYRASLERALRFKRLALIDAISPAAGLTAALIFAAVEPSVWVLVVQQLATAGTMLTALMISGRWLPGPPDRTAEMRGLLSIGGNLLGSQIIGYLANNTDSVVIGYRLGAAPLGLYNRAFQLIMQPFNQIRVPMTRVALPILARLHDDQERYRRFIAAGQLAIGYSVGVGMATIAGAALPLVGLFLGDKWLAAAPLMALLAIAAIFQSLGQVAYWMFVSKGLAGHLMRLSLMTASISIVSILIGSSFGLVGVAAGYAAAPFLSWPLSFWWLSRRAELPMKDLLSGAARVIIACSLAGGVSYLLSHLLTGTPYVVAGLGAVVGGFLVVAGLLLIVPLWRRDLATLRAIIRSIRR